MKDTAFFKLLRAKPSLLELCRVQPTFSKRKKAWKKQWSLPYEGVTGWLDKPLLRRGGAGESKKIVKSLEIFGSLNKKP